MPRQTSTKKAAPTRGLTPAQYREAERGLKLMLAKKFSAVWIQENTADLLTQANIEYGEWLDDNPPARKPVGWILTCAYRRALNQLDTETRKPPTAPLDSIFHLADDSTPTPEQVALDHDRQRRLRDALSHLPRKEAQLLALIYYEDYSIREAGRQLGWRKSAADRHHTAAMEKMLALVGDRKLLSGATIGPATSAYLHGDTHRHLDAAFAQAAIRPLLHAYAALSEAAEIVAHKGVDLARRIAPFSDPANAAAAGGAGRVAAQCGAAAGIAVCSLLAAPAVQQGLDALGRTHPAQPPARRAAHPRASRVSPTKPATPQPTTPKPKQTPRSEPTTERQRIERRERRARATSPPARASGHQSGSEFGDNNVEPTETEPAPSTETEPAPAAPPRADHGNAAPSSGPEFGL